MGSRWRPRCPKGRSRRWAPRRGCARGPGDCCCTARAANCSGPRRCRRPRADMRYGGIWTPADRAESIYRAVPFDVPPAGAGIAVALSYDRSAGVLDLGCAGPAGFRGWSGGARDQFVIAPDAASPGYLPGGLEPGEWQVWLGLHRVAAAGMRWEIEVEVGPATVPAPPEPPPAPAARPRRRDLPAEPGLEWLAGDLHSHSVHSDGSLTVDELALAEVWHWTWLDGSWGGPLAWWAAWGLDTVPVGGSDFHHPGQGRPLGAPT